MIWGGPGLGKSDIIQGLQHIRSLGKRIRIMDLRLALFEPTDLRGFPFLDQANGLMKWAPPSELPSAEVAAKYDLVILFLDELNSASPSVQAAAYQLVLNRRIGEYVLPDNVRIFAAGNGAGHMGVTYRMPAPLANRFRHVHLEVSYDDWQEWALNHNVHPDIIGYLSSKKHNLYKFDPLTASEAFATPRSWSFLSKVLYSPGFDDTDSYEQRAEIASAVGEGISLDFTEHRRFAAFLPHPEDVLSGKVTKLDNKVAKEISARCSLVVSMCYELNSIYKSSQKESDKGISPKFVAAFNNAVRFSYENFQPELVIVLFKTVMQDYKIDISVRKHLQADLVQVMSDKYAKYLTGV